MVAPRLASHEKLKKVLAKILYLDFLGKNIISGIQRFFIYPDVPVDISWRPRTTFLKHFESKRLYISIYLLKNIFVPETYKVSSGEGGMGEDE